MVDETQTGTENPKVDTLTHRFNVLKTLKGQWVEVTRPAKDSADAHSIIARLAEVSLTFDNVACTFDSYLGHDNRGYTILSDQKVYHEYGPNTEISVSPVSQQNLDKATTKKEKHWGF
jgi:hypothetical protein